MNAEDLSSMLYYEGEFLMLGQIVVGEVWPDYKEKSIYYYTTFGIAERIQEAPTEDIAKTYLKALAMKALMNV